MIYWDIETGKKKVILGDKISSDGHQDEILGIIAEENICLSCSKDRTIILWDIHNLKKIHSFIGHTGWVTV